MTRALLDYAAVASPRQLEQALAAAERAGRLDRVALLGRVAAVPTRPGARILRFLLDDDRPLAYARSPVEELLMELIRGTDGEVPEPRTNAIVEGIEVDFLWPAQRLIVETDGFEHHGRRHAFENDRDRDAALLAAGYRIMRVTWKQLNRKPNAVLARIIKALSAR